MSSIENAQVQQTQQWIGKTGKSGKQMVSYTKKIQKLLCNKRITANDQDNVLLYQTAR